MLPTYVVITPARNEAQYIELTINSLVAQTVPPRKWIIVSDGSTDGTDDIVERYISDHPWIELIRMPKRSERHFAGKVHAFNAKERFFLQVQPGSRRCNDLHVGCGLHYLADQARARDQMLEIVHNK